MLNRAGDEQIYADSGDLHFRCAKISGPFRAGGFPQGLAVHGESSFGPEV